MLFMTHVAVGAAGAAAAAAAFVILLVADEFYDNGGNCRRHRDTHDDGRPILCNEFKHQALISFPILFFVMVPGALRTTRYTSATRTAMAITVQMPKVPCAIRIPS